MVVVIPCFNEPDLLKALKALEWCDKPRFSVEVIVVINSGEGHPQNIKEQNQLTFENALSWAYARQSDHLKFHFIRVESLPQKQAGVGLARKIGMDEAVMRFELVKHDGIIVCFDADSVCEPNYLVELENHFKKNSKSPGCSIYFEHPLVGDEPDQIYRAITGYELHLRYYNQALRYCSLPYAYHTIGSSMAVRSSAYQKQGGMNKRQAGEDFYFLHKIIALGDFTELNSTCVIPSPRVSDRVPFGTGRAIGDFLKKNEHHYYTYSLRSFELVKKITASISLFYEHDVNDVLEKLGLNAEEKKALIHFFEIEKLTIALPSIRKNSPNTSRFVQRFLVWFDAFRVLKLVHYLRDHLYPDAPVADMACDLLSRQGIAMKNDARDLLLRYRELDRMGHWSRATD